MNIRVSFATGAVIFLAAVAFIVISEVRGDYIYIQRPKNGQLTDISKWCGYLRAMPTGGATCLANNKAKPTRGSMIDSVVVYLPQWISQTEVEVRCGTTVFSRINPNQWFPNGSGSPPHDCRWSVALTQSALDQRKSAFIGRCDDPAQCLSDELKNKLPEKIGLQILYSW